MRMSTLSHPSARVVDRTVTTIVVAASIGTLVVTTTIAFRTPEAFGQFLRRPLMLQQVHALWTGLLSSNLLVLQVIFMARLPWLERALGRRTLLRWHRRLGYWSFWLMIAHVLLFVLQRTQRDPDRVGSALWQLFAAEPWMLLASIGTALLILVVVTSIARARRRLRYETWHLIHLWAYLGMGLALPHQLVSRDFLTGATLAYWWALYLVGLLTVLAFRVALPLGRSAYHRLRVVEVRPEGAGAVSVLVAGRRLERLGARSGQFLTWRFLGSPGWTRGHPYSLSAAPTPDRLRVTVDTAGDGGWRAVDLVVGSRVLIEGPYGAMVTDRRRHPRLLLIAAGVGITPFRALLEDLPLQPGEATLLYRAHSEPEVLFADELAELARERGFSLVLLLGRRRAPGSWLPGSVMPGSVPPGSDPDAGSDSLLTELDDSAALLALVPDLQRCDVVLCGPDAWVAAVRQAAVGAGVRARDLHMEDFT